MPQGYRNTIRNIMGRLIIQEDGCAIWPQAKRGKKGYGCCEFEGRLRFVYHLLYEHFVGPIPEGLLLDHTCRNTSCCNFAHLEPVTPKENIHRGNSPTAINARKMHCPRGHPYSHSDKQGRVCRICLNERCKLRMRRVRACQAQLKLEQTSPDSGPMSL